VSHHNQKLQDTVWHYKYYDVRVFFPIIFSYFSTPKGAKGLWR
jgi:hypothetical protein